jgi:hypothetical protein
LGKDFRIIFLGEKIEFKRNYLKRKGQGSGATGPAQWKEEAGGGRGKRIDPWPI